MIEQKNSVEQKNKVIQMRFREELSLLIEKQGYGNTQNRNPAIRSFDNNQIIANITGIAVEAIFRRRTLRAICS